MSYDEVILAAKKAFEDIERSEYEKRLPDKKVPYLKSIGFVPGTKQVLVWR